MNDALRISGFVEFSTDVSAPFHVVSDVQLHLACEDLREKLDSR